ncbi:MAG: class I SAM-dependent methyltransferase [Prolixibacteraceae bacterium]|nr:class I SAM-dependent methyltransferase [Prolixibacteraceae bacterium]
MKFPESKLAHSLLDGLKGIEIGASAHNPFGLDTLNVDRYPGTDTVFFKQQEIKICGQAAPVDVVAAGDRLPFPDKSFDFVINSHVIEHFYDPIAAMDEWARVARKYIFIICPHAERTFDQGKPLTTIEELLTRHNFPETDYEEKHWSVWNTETFTELVKYLGYRINTVQNKDDKVGNGFTVVIKL